MLSRLAGIFQRKEIMADNVTDPTVTGSGDDSFAGDVQALTPAISSVAAAVGQYEQGQTTVKLAGISSNTIVLVAIAVAAIFILPAFFKSI